jgi:hypothetical protein
MIIAHIWGANHNPLEHYSPGTIVICGYMAGIETRLCHSHPRRAQAHDEDQEEKPAMGWKTTKKED